MDPNSSWKETEKALGHFFDALVCGRCKNTTVAAVRYSNCGHFFCKSCIDDQSVCVVCHTPVQPNEIQHDLMVENLIQGCKIIEEIIGRPKSRNGESSAFSETKTTVISSSQKRAKKPFNHTLKHIPRKIDKRNAKGETVLHNACTKGDEMFVKSLLDAGANPNTKDYADWTPLQEAASWGYCAICKLLLEAGAQPNTPGKDNKTALHEAASNNNIDEAKLLLQYKANPNVYDQCGKAPVDYAFTEEMRELLKQDKWPKTPEKLLDLNRTLDQSVRSTSIKMVIYPSNLSSESRQLLNKMATRHKVKIVSEFRPSITHVVVEANINNTAKLTYDVLLVILHGKWLLNSEWIRLSLELNDLTELDLKLFEVRSAPTSGTLTRARENAENQNPRLFNRCYFYFALNLKNTYTVSNIPFTKRSLAALVKEGDGAVLTREPNPEEIEANKLIPFHVSQNPQHPLHKCSHYIIYVPGKEEPRIKYNMPHIKSLPLVWLIECIEKFMLLDPALLGIS
ncbi:BRCA1-associated RING domain protein 1 [Orussus abietinus]|uniref:BRCA1-associated RING domain protein 1 n=1 Tax=Orussus abietinus TaxID=222816 RepID=UPI000626C957|nr:BRCA1-associated RING domain protein 1 [Orussus abietinus]XP_023289736.1 BRCA1-associated RING domain protein 1 [Orussus abietinus]